MRATLICTFIMLKICQSAATSATSSATRAATPSPLPSCSATAARCPQERPRGMFLPCTHLEYTWNLVYSMSIITGSLTIMRTQTTQPPNVGLTQTALTEPMCSTNNTVHRSARRHPLETRVCIRHTKQTLDRVRSDGREFRPP